MSGHVFARGAGLPAISHARGVEMFDTDGRRYLDAAGGAVVVGVGHGCADVVEAAAAQARQVAYAHGTAFRAEVVEEYAAALASLLPVPDARVYPVSGGSEAVETALKMARAYHLARGQDRSVVIGRTGAYHGNSRGALDVSGRAALRGPYLPWLGAARHTSSPYEYRCGFDTHPHGCGTRHAQALEELILQLGPEQVAAFIAEPVAGAALGACVPPEDYWPAVVEVCRRHGVLVIADEVMTGFGRTGRWFGCEHWGVQPDLLTAGKGASSGYWPLGLAVASGPVHDTISSAGSFVHGFTYSHHVVGAATGMAVLRRLQDDGLVEASRAQGAVLRQLLGEALGGHPHVGEIRGVGLLVGVELVADRESAEPFPRGERVTERVVTAARDRGLLVYSSTGCADGTRGDLVLLGPPLVVADTEVAEIADLLAAAVSAVTAP